MLTACNSLFYHPDAMRWTLPDQISNSFEEHRIPVGAEGETLHAWHFKTQKNKKGTVVHFHGNAQNMSAHILFVAWFLNEGFDLVTFDYRGYGLSDGRATRENTVEDGEAVLRWLTQREKKKNVFVVGQSLGGAIAPVALQRSAPGNVAGVILESTFASYRDLAQRKLASFFLTWPVQWPLSFLVTDTLSPKKFADGFPFPTLLVHGTRDPVVPYSEGLELAHQLQQAKSSHITFQTELGRGHTSCFASTELTPCKRTTLSFMDSTLQNSPSSQREATK